MASRPTRNHTKSLSSFSDVASPFSQMPLLPLLERDLFKCTVTALTARGGPSSDHVTEGPPGRAPASARRPVSPVCPTGPR